MTTGVIFTLVVIGGALAYFAWRSLRGKEIDRRLIFLVIGATVALPLIFPLEFEHQPSPLVERIYERIEALPPGSQILLSYDFDPGMAPEVQPMADVITRHVLARGHRIAFMSLWATGQAQLNQTLNNVIPVDFPEAEIERDWVNLGFKAGNEGVLRVIASDLPKMFPTDVEGRPTAGMPALEGIRSAGDFDLVISFGGGKPGPREWILFVADPTGVDFAAGTAAVSAPELYPYYPNQMLGLMGGAKGAAEYETAFMGQYEQFADMPSPGRRIMGPLTMAHIVILALIVLGNVIYFRSRRERGTA